MSETITYLSRRSVSEALAEVDAPAVITSVLIRHARGECVVPAEAHTRWATPSGAHARSLVLPGILNCDPLVVGAKVINSSLSNVRAGRRRADGLTLLFDPETAQVVCVMDAALISATRTACVSLLTVEAYGVAGGHVALIGAGELGRAHAELFVRELRGLKTIDVYDLASDRAEALVIDIAAFVGRRIDVRKARSVEEAVTAADVIVAATTATQGYLELEWLKPGAVLANVSLDDPKSELFLGIERLFVDDWNLIVADEHRMLGKFARSGMVVRPDGSPTPGGRMIDGTIGQLLAGQIEGRRNATDRVLVNPFGLGIEDVALADEVFRVARQKRLGCELER